MAKKVASADSHKHPANNAPNQLCTLIPMERVSTHTATVVRAVVSKLTQGKGIFTPQIA